MMSAFDRPSDTQQISMHVSEATTGVDECRPLLSICIPTYNRCDQVVLLVESLLRLDGPFEVCVHIDGSTDGTARALAKIAGQRLRVRVGSNQGRAGALLAACQAARGRFIMIFDDDDELYPAGLRTVLADCSAEISPHTVGFIYHLEGEQHAIIGSDFPTERTNFLKLRADHRVTGDKKEVVLADRLMSVAFNPHGRFRRVPTSLLWSRLSLDFDVICRNVVIGRKAYLADGMTANISSIKKRNAYPLVLLYCTHLKGFVRGRYRSIRFFARALVRAAVYSGLAVLGLFMRQ